jgi:protein PhnA
MSEPKECPQCQSSNIYFDGNLWVCPECGHEWTETLIASSESTPEHGKLGIRDAHGNPLADGDTVIVIKDLKVKGSSSVIKGGTKVKNIRLSDAGDGHDIACKIDGFGSMNLKSEFVKKA